MYERFTDRARKIMALANQEACNFQHEYIGTEHLLLGLIKEGSGVGANVLKNLDVDLRKVRLEVEKLIKAGPDMVTMGRLPHTPRAKKVIEYSIEEARNLGHNYVGTEHLLLGLIREQDGVGAQILMNFGLSLEKVREETMSLLGIGDKVEDAKELDSPNVPVKQWEYRVECPPDMSFDEITPWLNQQAQGGWELFSFQWANEIKWPKKNRVRVSYRQSPLRWMIVAVFKRLTNAN